MKRYRLWVVVGALAPLGVAFAAERDSSGYFPEMRSGMMGSGMMGSGMMGRPGGSPMMQPAAPYEAGADGRDIFESQCAGCHSLKPDAQGIGPSLYEILGRKAGTVAGYRYSDAMKNSGVDWNEASLDRFIEGPRDYIPGNNMPFAGIPDKDARGRLIEFLKTQSE